MLYAINALMELTGIQEKIEKKKVYDKIPLPHFIQVGPINRR